MARQLLLLLLLWRDLKLQALPYVQTTLAYQALPQQVRAATAVAVLVLPHAQFAVLLNVIVQPVYNGRSAIAGTVQHAVTGTPVCMFDSVELGWVERLGTCHNH